MSEDGTHERHSLFGPTVARAIELARGPTRDQRPACRDGRRWAAARCRGDRPRWARRTPPWSDGYFAFRDFELGPAQLHLQLSLGQWSADGLLAIFFFVAGLELKREFVVGDLKDPAMAALPVAAAMCGVAVPAFLYLVVASGVASHIGGAGNDGDLLAGWAVPIATDIAFALAVLAILGAPAVSTAFLPAHLGSGG